MRRTTSSLVCGLLICQRIYLDVFFAGDYKKAYPNAKLIAPKDAIERHGDPDLKFDGRGWSFHVFMHVIARLSRSL